MFVINEDYQAPINTLAYCGEDSTQKVKFSAYSDDVMM